MSYAAGLGGSAVWPCTFLAMNPTGPDSSAQTDSCPCSGCALLLWIHLNLTCGFTSNLPHHHGFCSNLNSQLSLAVSCGLPWLDVVDGLLAGEAKCCQSTLANVLGTLNPKDFNAVAEFPKPVDLAMESSRQFSMWVSASEIRFYFEGFLSILTKGG